MKASRFDRLLPASLLALLLTCAGLAAAQPLRVMTHGSFDLSRTVLEEFTDRTGVEVEILPAGDAGEALSRAILTRGRPLADVLFGVDNSLLPRAADADIFEPYRSPLLEGVPEIFHFDPQYRVTPVDAGYVAFNIDLEWFAERDMQPPAHLEDLADPRYRSLTIVLDPATSSPGLSFLLTTVARYGATETGGAAEGDGDWLDYWVRLRENDALVLGGWTDAYYTAFSRYGGDRPVVLSYLTSPAAEVMFAEEPLEAAPTGNLLCRECVWLQIEGAGILRGSSMVEEAQAFIDFLLSPEVQEDIPGVMFVYPVVPGTELPEAFSEFAPQPAPEELATLESGVLAANLESWLDQWTAVMVQGRDPAAVRP